MTEGWVYIVVVLVFGAILFGFLFILFKSKQSVDYDKKSAIDTFQEYHGYSWDFVISFKVYEDDEELNDDQIKFNMKYVLRQLSLGGLDFKLFYSDQRNIVFCKIRAPPTRLLQEADRIDMVSLLDEGELRKLCSVGRISPENVTLWNPLRIPEISEQTSLTPYKFIYCKIPFDSEIQGVRDDMANLFTQHDLSAKKNISMKTRFTETFVMQSPMLSYKAKKTDTEIPESLASLNSTSPIFSIFRGVDRLKLMHSIISSNAPNCCNLDIYKLVKSGAVQAYFPLHDVGKLRELENNWVLFFQFPWNQDTSKVKDYFGEKIALYFAWLGFYTSFLIIAAFFGFITWVLVTSDNSNPNAAVVPYFAAFMAIWSSVFLEFWKRKEKYISMEWGMVGFEQNEQVRPQFHGLPAKSPVDGRIYLYHSRFDRFKKSMQSNVAIFGYIVIVIATIASIFVLRVALSSVKASINGDNLATVISSLALALLIQVCNSIFGEYAIYLNDTENHRTDTEYEDALISKTFMFQFVNSYAALFYIAFIKPFIPALDSCTKDDCMFELQTTLAVIFLSRLIIGNFFELIVPIVSSLYERRQYQRKNIRANTSLQAHDLDDMDSMKQTGDIENTFYMPSYDVMLGSFREYAEMSIQFGYCTMFVAAFPLATLMSLINNYVELRIDAWKICNITRRPEPRSCEDIGTWYFILEIISMVAIVVNSALVAFTGTFMLNYTWAVRVWIFFLMSAALTSIRVLVAYLVPDVPLEVSIQLQRQEYIIDKVLNNVKDEDDDAAKSLDRIPVYSILATDTDPR